MKKTYILALLLLICASPALSQAGRNLKVFISVDMEGVTGVVNGEEVSRSGKDYDYFRRIMTLETNSAIEGARAAGATEIVVRDSHGSARNILPDLLSKNARLLRDWSGGPKSMMEGVDETFAAVIFIGYHARAGTPDALLEHTMTGTVTDVSINGVSLPEAGINALIAGHYNVPVVFAAGDEALCKQVKHLFGAIETVSVKKGIGGAALNLHPEVSRERIRAGVEKALRNRNQYKPYKLSPPYTLVLKLKDEKKVYNGQFYPGAERTGDWELTFKSNDLMEVIKAFGAFIR
jgi:D-amino peptidase